MTQPAARRTRRSYGYSTCGPADGDDGDDRDGCDIGSAAAPAAAAATAAGIVVTVDAPPGDLDGLEYDDVTELATAVRYDAAAAHGAGTEWEPVYDNDEPPAAAGLPPAPPVYASPRRNLGTPNYLAVPGGTP